MRRSVTVIIGVASILNSLFLFSSGADTIPGSFSQIDMQCGGYYTGVIQHNSGRLYGRTDGGGVYLSDDGFTWKYLSGDMTSFSSLCVAAIAVPQTVNSSSNLVLQAVGADGSPADPVRGIWKSTNGGANWSQTMSNVNFWGDTEERKGGEQVIFHPTNDLEVWAGSYGQGLYKSMDAGSTWSFIGGFPSSNIVSSICIHPSFPDQIFEGGVGGVWVSVDHGTTWTQVVSFSSMVLHVVRAPDGTVYFGGENGSQQVIEKITSTNWADPTSYVVSNLYAAYMNGSGGGSDALTCLMALRNGWVVAGDYGNCRLTTNGGASFVSLPRTYVPNSVVPQWAASPTIFYEPNGLIQDVFASNTWYGSGGFGPMRTDDGGHTWQFILTGIGEVVTTTVAFHPTDSNRLGIPASDVGGAVVTDGGFSGNTASMLKPFFPSDGLEATHRVLISSNNGVNRYIFCGGETFNNRPRLYITTNDGASWYYPGMLGLPTNSPGQIMYDGVDSLDNPDDYLVACGGSSGPNMGGVYRTTNGGNSFTQCNWYPVNSVNLGSGGYWNIWLARDATNVNVRYLYGRAAKPATPPATNTGGGMFISTNRGVDWTQETFPLVPGDTSDYAAQMVADHKISGSIWLAIRGAASGHGLMHSFDGGNSWYIVPAFNYVVSVDALNGIIVVNGTTKSDAWNKIYYSGNNGTNWNEITRTNYRFGNGIYVSLDPFRTGRVFISTDERSVGIFNPSNLPPPLPVIVRHPASHAVAVGATATLNVSAASAAPLFYQWQFNGANFKATNPTLTVPFFAASNSGYYDVVVSNVSGSVTSTVAVLSLANLPGTTLPGTNQMGVLGSNVTVSAGATGTSPFLYQWRFNGSVLPRIITTIAGNGSPGESGDGGMATNAALYAGTVTLGPGGVYYIADAANERVRKVDANGVITTVAGNGTGGFTGDGGAATNAQLLNPAGVAADALGNVYIADQANNRVRLVSNGIITTFAGNGVAQYWGDTWAATNANLSLPSGLAVDPWNNLYIADQGNNVIRQVATNGIIYTVAGTGAGAFGGDGGPATLAYLSSPVAVAVDSLGNLYIADSGNRRIRKVTASGIISTVAGSGYTGYYGDGGPATNAFMEAPAGVAVDFLGNVYIADGTQRVREVGLNGIINTVAGNAGMGYSGDGGAATNAKLSAVYGLAVDGTGNLLIADTGNNVVRQIGAYGAELALNNFGLLQAGQYQLIVSNAYGATTSAVVVVTAALPPLGASVSGGGSVQLQFSGMAGSNYVVEMATNLTPPANWKRLDTNTIGTNGIGSFTDTNLSGPARFYRLGLP